ncbi:MAG: patatin-like phospholipase family protein [Candidatus Azambacteria bacterium]|nr:patatin-like phospholipase family protein [Candidatus Azambacteria bacterium]
MEKPKKIGLALGGGAARGLTHIGVIKALENAGISIDYIAGTSMGAIIGGYYAATKDIRRLEEVFSNIKRKDVFSFRDLIKNKDGAFFKGELIANRLRKELGDIEIEKCQIPFTAVATNVNNGEEELLNTGNLADAIGASSAIPLIFSPVEINGKLLMDGGLANPVPADVVKKMGAEYVIAVDTSSRWLEVSKEMVSVKDMYGVITQALSTLEYHLAKNILGEYADLVIKPPIFHQHWFQFENAPEVIKIGVEETNLYLKEIRQKTGYKKQEETLSEKFIDFILN